MKTNKIHPNPRITTEVGIAIPIPVLMAVIGIGIILGSIVCNGATK